MLNSKKDTEGICEQLWEKQNSKYLIQPCLSSVHHISIHWTQLASVYPGTSARKPLLNEEAFP